MALWFLALPLQEHEVATEFAEHVLFSVPQVYNGAMSQNNEFDISYMILANANRI